MRCLAATIAVLALGATGLVIQGCGDDAPAPQAGDPGTGNLQITYIPGAGATPRQADLVCPAMGSDAAAACEQIESLTAAFDPVPGDQACSQQYGGPEQIVLYGRWAGQPVDTTLTRTNGCEIDRYESLAPVLLPLVGGPGGG
ncbi:MAG: hypothetical protein ACKOGE_07165 [Actinomycetota bacterium]